MTREDWKVIIKALPRGLSGVEVARKLKKRQGNVLFWLRRFGYKYRDGRRVGTQRLERRFGKANWLSSDAELGRKYRCTREYMRQVRMKLRKPRGPEARGKRNRV